MASAFDRRTTVLSYYPRAPVRWAQRKFLLWPAWTYRVLAPRPRERALNILQRAVLGLCRAGVRRTDDVGQRLDVARDLAAHVLRELMEMGALSDGGEPTKHGLELLERDRVDVQEQISAYVFQDPWTRELWPRMVERQQPQDVELDKDTLLLRLGSKGAPSRQRPHLVFPEPGLPQATPRPEQILRAALQHQRRQRFIAHEDLFEPEDEDSERPAVARALARTSLIDEVPRPVFLVTYLYLPEDTSVGAEWNVCDPFGLGASPSLRQAIQHRLKADKPLADVVRGLLGEAGDALEDALAESVARLEEEAAFEVERRLTGAIRHTPLFPALVAMESAHIEMQRLGNRCPAHKREHVVVEAQKAVERLFTGVWERYPARGCNEMLQPKSRDNALLFEGIARELGFEIPLPHRLVFVKADKVHWAARQGKGTLRPRLLAALLAAHRTPAHPLRPAARRFPKLLERLDALAELRDTGGAHSTDRSLTEGQVTDAVATVYDAVAAIQGASVATLPSSSSSGAS